MKHGLHDNGRLDSGGGVPAISPPPPLLRGITMSRGTPGQREAERIPASCAHQLPASPVAPVKSWSRGRLEAAAATVRPSLVVGRRRAGVKVNAARAERGVPRPERAADCEMDYNAAADGSIHGTPLLCQLHQREKCGLYLLVKRRATLRRGTPRFSYTGPLRGGRDADVDHGEDEFGAPALGTPDNLLVHAPHVEEELQPRLVWEVQVERKFKRLSAKGRQPHTESKGKRQLNGEGKRNRRLFFYLFYSLALCWQGEKRGRETKGGQQQQEEEEEEEEGRSDDITGGLDGGAYVNCNWERKSKHPLSALLGSLCALSAEWAEEAEETLELRTKPKAARRPAGWRLELKPGGRRPDWLVLGSRDLEDMAWGCGGGGAAAAGGGGRGGGRVVLNGQRHRRRVKHQEDEMCSHEQTEAADVYPQWANPPAGDRNPGPRYTG
ncbi:hypothetical protein EYF80_010676 [Liparis tanakae]|uniref:Uncharacterized protein n=1 Tax=Liparis tanakae TaxID=230148 RepID=A0A4Z2IMJ9_9TELE|nr:hypothetical protein EYF80_010676 [Liparis tanakae]